MSEDGLKADAALILLLAGAATRIWCRDSVPNCVLIPLLNNEAENCHHNRMYEARSAAAIVHAKILASDSLTDAESNSSDVCHIWCALLRLYPYGSAERELREQYRITGKCKFRVTADRLRQWR